MPKKLAKDLKHIVMGRTCLCCTHVIETTAKGLKAHFKACCAAKRHGTLLED